MTSYKFARVENGQFEISLGTKNSSTYESRAANMQYFDPVMYVTLSCMYFNTVNKIET